MMNEQFTPAQQVQPKAINQMVPANPDQMAQVALAQEVMTTDSFNDLMRRTTEYETFGRNLVKIESKEQFDAVSVKFIAVKEDYKVAEEMRKQAVAFPSKFVMMVNKLFKESIKDSLNNLKITFGRYRDDWIKREEDKLAEELRAKTANRTQDQMSLPGPIGEGVTEIDAPPIEAAAPVETVTRTDQGTVYQREELNVEVVDVIKLLKTIVSTDKRYAYITADLVEIKQGALKQLVRDNPKRAIPGVKAGKVRRSV